MSAFYLTFEPFRIPMTNFFHYTPIGNGVYEERLIAAQDGQPAANPPRQVVFSLSKPLEWKNSGLAADADHLLQVPASNDLIGFIPIVEGKDQVVWEGALQAAPDATGFAFAKDALRIILPQISRRRMNLGYVLARQNAGARGDFPMLHQNVDIFWSSLRNVCENIVIGIQQSLDHPGPDAPFQHPEWVFYLNRALLEGFTEGHARPQFQNRNFALTASSNYAVKDDSSTTWLGALEQADADMDISKFRSRFPPDGVRTTANVRNHPIPGQEGDKRRVLDELAIAAIDSFGLQGKFLDNVDFFLDVILNILTPGSTDAQKFNFWQMHYPHWNKDLLYALVQLATYGVPIQEIEWDHITQIIFSSYPSEGVGLSLPNQLLKIALEVAHAVHINVPEQFTAIVRHILALVAEDAQAAAEKVAGHG